MASKKILIQIQVGAKDANIAVNSVTKSLEGLSSAQMKVTKATQKGRAQSGLNNAILLESGRLASDLNYGFTAIANNLGQLVTLFGSFAETNGGVVASFKELGKSIWGMGGILIGVQLLIAFGQDIFDFFMGIDEASKKAAKSTKELATQLDTLGANMFIAEEYLNILENSNISEEERANIIKELTKLVPDLREEDFKYGNNLDKVKEKINQYAIAQASRIEIDKLVVDNSELLTKRREINNIKAIKDKVKQEEALKEYLLKNEKRITINTGVEISKRDNIRTSSRKKTLQELLETFNFFNQDIINQSDSVLEQIKKLTDTSFLGGKGDNLEKIIKYQESTIGNTEKEIRLLIKLRDLRNKYVQKTLDLQVKSEEKEIKNKEDLDALAIAEVASVENKRKLALLELQDLEMSEGLKGQARTDINAYYDALQIENAEKRKDALDEINRLEAQSKLDALDMIGKGLMSASKIAGSATGVGKALAIAGTTVSTYSAAQKAYESQMQLTPDSPIRAQIARAAAILGGLANVRAIMAVKSPAMKETSVTGGTSGAVSVQAPDFNVVGAGGVNQLGQVIGSQFGQPLRAYVVSGDITSAQELDRSITTGATIG
jgi:hypothetical protein